MKIRFPFLFKGLHSKDPFQQTMMPRNARFIPLRRVNQYLGKGSLESFSKIYTNVLQAMCDFDYDYLSQIMEPKLYKECQECLQDIQGKGYTLQYLEQDVYDPDASESEEELEGVKDRKKSEDNREVMGFKVKGGPLEAIVDKPMGYVYGEKDLKLFIDAKGAFGIHIDRSKNIGMSKLFGRFEGTTMNFYKGGKNTWKDLIDRQVLIFNVHYNTTRKLVLKDTDGEIIEGSENPKEVFSHKFRFETYTNEIDWVLTDIDNFLHGNPFVQDRVAVETE